MRSSIRHMLNVVITRNYGIRWLFGAALVPGVLTVVGLLYEIYQTERNQLEQGALQTSRALAHAVDKDLAGINGELPSIFHLPTCRHYAANSFSC